jgi:hypothetical protein
MPPHQGMALLCCSQGWMCYKISQLLPRAHAHCRHPRRHLHPLTLLGYEYRMPMGSGPGTINFGRREWRRRSLVLLLPFVGDALSVGNQPIFNFRKTKIDFCKCLGSRATVFPEASRRHRRVTEAIFFAFHAFCAFLFPYFLILLFYCFFLHF